MTAITITVEDSLARELESIAAQKGATLDDFARLAVARFVADVLRRRNRRVVR